jgi:thiamine-phosphate pyrophosphorylase
LAKLLDEVPIAAVRLDLESRDEEVISRAADALRGMCHARDVPLVIGDHFRVVRRLGLDGVHLKGTRDLRDARSELADGAIMGTYCGASRHAGMNAGEMGADYVSFGPVSETGLGSAEIADTASFEWWHQMIEVPCVAEGEVSLEAARTLAPYADFIALGSEVWTGEEPPLTRLQSYAQAIGLS